MKLIKTVGELAAWRPNWPDHPHPYCHTEYGRGPRDCSFTGIFLRVCILDLIEFDKLGGRVRAEEVRSPGL